MPLTAQGYSIVALGHLIIKRLQFGHARLSLTYDRMYLTTLSKNYEATLESLHLVPCRENQILWETRCTLADTRSSASGMRTVIPNLGAPMLGLYDCLSRNEDSA